MSKKKLGYIIALIPIKRNNKYIKLSIITREHCSRIPNFPFIQSIHISKKSMSKRRTKTFASRAWHRTTSWRRFYSECRTAVVCESPPHCRAPDHKSTDFRRPWFALGSTRPSSWYTTSWVCPHSCVCSRICRRYDAWAWSRGRCSILWDRSRVSDWTGLRSVRRSGYHTQSTRQAADSSRRRRGPNWRHERRMSVKWERLGGNRCAVGCTRESWWEERKER